MNEPIIAIGLSVLMHVAWNLIARQQPSDAFPLWWVLLGHLLVFAPWGFHALVTEVNWTVGFTLLLTGSAIANTLYFNGLRKAYEHAPAALVYPLVRSSPLLIALWGALSGRETLSLGSWVGILISVSGLWLLSHSAFTYGSARRALPWILLAMLATSVYSLTDKAATTSIPSLAALFGFVSVGYLSSWLSMSLTLKYSTGHWIPTRRIDTCALIAGGLCIGTAYVLVIHAMRFLPAAEVVSYTNAGIVLASLLSIFYFKERQDWRRRLLGALIVASGLAVMAI
ncbi:MAG: EamA family transporter [Gammaproteobacteria bacterium HGW-Gammaproteobacteria-11]|nr:MAG: EamA family transporter [Gammaproteobacteria bacterium HGW-Gammaproteobacteria-11]